MVSMETGLERSMRWIAVLTLALCFGSASANAQPVMIAQERFGGWSLQSFRSSPTGQFSHCAASASYQSGITLLYSVNSRIEWSMGFASDRWNLQQGARIPVEFAIDGLPSRSATGTAVNSRHVVVPLPDDAQLFQQMRGGNRMIVAGAGETVPFQLTGTSVVLAALLRCANDSGRSIVLNAPQPASRPNVAVNPAPPAPPQQPAGVTADMRLEATQFVANLLSQAEMRGFRLLTSSEIRSANTSTFVRSSDVAWRGDTAAGTLHIHPNQDPRSLDRLAADIIASDARACPGEFLTGRTADEDMTNVRRLHTLCGHSNGSIEAISYLLLPMPGQIVYQLSTATTVSRNEAAAEDRRLRDAVHAVVSRHPAFGSGSPPPTRAPEPAQPMQRRS